MATIVAGANVPVGARVTFTPTGVANEVRITCTDDDPNVDCTVTVTGAGVICRADAGAQICVVPPNTPLTVTVAGVQRAPAPVVQRPAAPAAAPAAQRAPAPAALPRTGTGLRADRDLTLGVVAALAMLLFSASGLALATRRARR